MSKVYVSDVGTYLILNCGTNISTASLTQVKVQKPSGATPTWTGSIYSSNYVRHRITTGDLSIAGTYHVQSYVEMGTYKGRGETAAFEVRNKFSRRRNV